MGQKRKKKYRRFHQTLRAEPLTTGSTGPATAVPVIEHQPLETPARNDPSTRLETQVVQNDLLRTLIVVSLIGSLLAGLAIWSRTSPTLHQVADAVARWLKLG